MMQAQISNRVMTAPSEASATRPYLTAGTLTMVATATVAANILMALGWSHLLGGETMAQAAGWLRLVWLLGFGVLLASNNALAALALWGWARRAQQQSEMRKLVRWARREHAARLSHSFPLVALPALVLLAPALLLLI